MRWSVLLHNLQGVLTQDTLRQQVKSYCEDRCKPADDDDLPPCSTGYILELDATISKEDVDPEGFPPLAFHLVTSTLRYLCVSFVT